VIFGLVDIGSSTSTLLLVIGMTNVGNLSAQEVLCLLLYQRTAYLLRKNYLYVSRNELEKLLRIF